MVNLEPGPRPRQIDGAPVYTVESYLLTLKDNPPANTNDNQRFAIEGIVEKQGERFGAYYVALHCEDSARPFFTFEDGIRGRFHFDEGQRVLLLGERSSETVFFKFRVVSQVEIDEALLKESHTP